MSLSTVMAQVTIGDFELARRAAEWIEITAIIIIAGSVLIAFGSGLVALIRSDVTNAIRLFKRVIAGGLLMGLDLLIAADVIKTITVEPTLENIASLGLLVLIRTFLSWSLILEVSGRWPWQRRPLNPDGE